MFALITLAIASQAADWKTDPLLDKAITVRGDAGPVEELVEEIGKAAGVKLAAMPEVGERRVIAMVSDTPAREVMEKLAAHYDATWRTGKEGYELYQTAKQKKDQADALREFLLRPYRRWRQEAIDEIKQGKPSWEDSRRKTEKLIEEELLLGGRYEDEYLNGNTQSQNAWYEKRKALDKKMGEIGRAHSGLNRAFQHLLASLKDDELVGFEYEQYVIYASNPTPMQRRLPEAARQAAVDWFEEYAGIAKAENGFNEVDQRLKAALKYPDIPDLKPSDVVNFRIKITPGELQLVERHKVEEVRADLILNREPWKVSVPLNTDLPVGDDFRPLMGDKAVMPAEPSTLLDRPFAQTDEMMVKMANLKKVNIRPDVEFYRGGSRFPSWWPAEIHSDVAVLGKFNFLADGPPDEAIAYTLNARDTTFRKIFTTFADQRRLDAEIDGNWLIMKSRYRPWQMACEMPSSDLLRYRDFMRSYSMDNWAGAFGLYSSEKRRSNGPYANYLPWFTVSDFWNALGPSTQAALEQGQVLKAGGLNAKAQEALYEHLKALSAMSFENKPTPVFDAAEVEWTAKAGWPKQTTPRLRGDTEITELMPNGVPPNLEIRYAMFQREATFGMFGTHPDRGMPISYLVANWAEQGVPDEFNLGLTTEERNFFSYNAPNFVMGYRLSGFAESKGPMYKTWAELPAAFRKRMEAAMEAAREGAGTVRSSG